MTEEPTEYQVEGEGEKLHPALLAQIEAVTNSEIHKSSRAVMNSYYRRVADFAEAFVKAGATDIEEIANNAIALTDKLIEKVEEKT